MFAFRLCLALGFPHPDVLLAQISSRQLAEWQAFYVLDPWGERRGDLRNALLGTLIGAVQGQKVPMSRFMPFDTDIQEREKERETKTKTANMRMWFEGQLMKQGKKVH